MKNEYLYHHGILGQKWGKRNGPPYPLDENDHSVAEKKAATKYVSLDGTGIDGRKKTVSKLNAHLDKTNEYQTKGGILRYLKTVKTHKKYDKSAAKDIEKAIKEGNMKVAKDISAGRTFVGYHQDYKFANMVIGDAAEKAGGFKIGEDFTYDIMRNNDFGGITVYINGKPIDQYIYGDEEIVSKIKNI